MAAASDPRLEDETVESSRMTLGEHLEELRLRLIRSAIAVGVAFAGAWAFHEPLAAFATRPYERAAAMLDRELVEIYAERVRERPEDWSLYFTSQDEATRDLRPEERVRELRGDTSSTGFFYLMRVCVAFGLLFGGPVVLWELWQFVAAGLYRRERRIVYSYFPASVGLFAAGVLFGYFAMVPYGIYFLARMTIGQFEYWETMDNYWSFLTNLTLALGAVFQLPLVMLVLARVGLVEARTFARYRKHFLVSALVVAAVLTPPDPFSQMLMAVPMVLLFELGVLAARIPVKARGAEDAGPS